MKLLSIVSQRKTHIFYIIIIIINDYLFFMHILE